MDGWMDDYTDSLADGDNVPIDNIYIQHLNLKKPIKQ